jgi:hypothetical protein
MDCGVDAVCDQLEDSDKIRSRNIRKNERCTVPSERRDCTIRGKRKKELVGEDRTIRKADPDPA